MLFMNEYEVERAERRYADDRDLPNLARAAATLTALVDWANANSDGWHSWPKPCRAAAKLQTMLMDAETAYRTGGDMHDATDYDLRAALSPVKSFLTRQGVAHSEVIR